MNDLAWAIVNVLSGATVSLLVAYLLGAHSELFNAIERVGLGITGGATLLTIGPILSRSVISGITPFDDWSGTLLRIGCATFLIGVMARLEGYAPQSRLTPGPNEPGRITGKMRN